MTHPTRTMSEMKLPEVLAGLAAPLSPSSEAAAGASCGACLGSGGWFRYEPALEPAPGLLYLSCVECRGSGRMAPARD